MDKIAPGSHQSETNKTIQGVRSKTKKYDFKGDLTKANMRTENEQERIFTDEEIGQFVRFGDLLMRIHLRLEGWKERLKTEPEGFAITEGIYDCNLCRKSMRDSDGWYDEFGLKCPLCRKAVNDGVVPGSAALDSKTWFSVSGLTSKYDWRHTTVHQKARSGELKARIVRNANGKPYFYVFMKEENPSLV